MYSGSKHEKPPIDFSVREYCDTEWRKTQCMPREVCVDVGKEFGATTNTFFKPPCVSIYRCGGCCNSEGLQCMNISTNYISKTVSSHSYYSPSVPCKSIYDHAYLHLTYCHYEEGK